MKSLAGEIFRKLTSFRSAPINKLDFRSSFPQMVKSLNRIHGNKQAMKLAVGGDFEAIGFLELETLKHFGLTEHSYVIDVGCGSGRLTSAISQYLNGRYLGIDIVPSLVDHARQISGRPSWRFEVAEGLSIPEEEGVADMVCFFSVFTHLLHEQTYIYLQEAKRVLKPRGRIIFSFLDFTISDHWLVFESNIKDVGIESGPLNMFISRDAIKKWAEHLGLKIQAIEDGDKSYVPLSKPVTFENGRVMENFGTIVQSVCALVIK